MRVPNPIEQRVRIALALCGWLVGTSAVVMMLVETGRAVADATTAGREAGTLVATLLAEEAANQAIEQGGVSVIDRSGYRAHAGVADTGRFVHARVGSGLGTVLFEAPILDGAAPSELGTSLTVVARPFESVDDVAKRTALPRDGVRLEPDGSSGVFGPLQLRALPPVVRDATRGCREHDVVEDRSIGLELLTVGTDAPDFVLAPTEKGTFCRLPDVGAKHAVDIPGNLWVGSSPGESVHVVLSEPTTLRVAGNVYLLGSLHVDGDHPLVIVADRVGDSAFEDRDLDGAFSSGDVPNCSSYRGRLEGSGCVYMGVPGAAPRVDARIDAALVVDGDLLVAQPMDALRDSRAVTTVSLHAALCLAGRVLPDAARSQLRFVPDRLLDPARSSMPGFVPSGRPRHGRLQRSRR